MITTTVHTNISSTSVDGITVLMIVVDTEAGWGSGIDAEGLVLLPTGVTVPEIQVGSNCVSMREKGGSTCTMDVGYLGWKLE